MGEGGGMARMQPPASAGKIEFQSTDPFDDDSGRQIVGPTFCAGNPAARCYFHAL